MVGFAVKLVPDGGGELPAAAGDSGLLQDEWSGAHDRRDRCLDCGFGEFHDCWWVEVIHPLQLGTPGGPENQTKKISGGEKNRRKWGRVIGGGDVRRGEMELRHLPYLARCEDRARVRKCPHSWWGAGAMGSCDLVDQGMEVRHCLRDWAAAGSFFSRFTAIRPRISSRCSLVASRMAHWAARAGSSTLTLSA